MLVVVNLDDLSESRDHHSPAALRDAIRTDLDQALLPRRFGKDFKALIMLSRAPVFFGALPVYHRLDELLQSALDSLSAIPIFMSCAEAGKDKPNRPWSFPALISRFAAILVQHRKIVHMSSSWALRATNCSFLPAKTFWTSSMLCILQVATLPHPPWCFFLHRSTILRWFLM